MRRRTTLFQQRLAAIYHQRQVAVLQRADRLARSLASRARQAVRDAATRAVRVRTFDVRKLNRMIDEVVLTLIDDCWQDLLALARSLWRRLAADLVGAMPRTLQVYLLNTLPYRESDGIETQYSLRGVPPDELARVLAAQILPQPSEEEILRWLTVAPPGGMNWEQRLARWGEEVRQRFLTEITQGLAAGETPDGIEARLRPIADGIAYKSERIARTEAMRVAERANLAMCDELGDIVTGQQILAVMDQWTRPHHAARNGKIYRKAADGVYRDEQGQPLPDLPDEPNCRCMTVPVLEPPPMLARNPEMATVFATATGRLIPDPVSYLQWWQQASVKEKQIAVGAKRYQAARDILGRPPEWIDLLRLDGTLLSIEELRQETAADRQMRREQLQQMLADRERLFRQVASRGFVGN